MKAVRHSGAWMPSLKRPMPRVSRWNARGIRRMYLREGRRWRRTHSGGISDDKDFVRNPNCSRHPLHATASGVQPW